MCICVFMYKVTWVPLHVFVYAPYIPVYGKITCKYKYVCVYVRVSVYACIYVYTYVCIYMYVHVYFHTYAYTTQEYLHVYIYM